MGRTVFALLSLVGMTMSVAFPDSSRAAGAPGAEVIKLNHTTDMFLAHGSVWRYQMTGTIADGVGKGKIRIEEVDIRNIFSEATDKRLKDREPYLCDITLKLSAASEPFLAPFQAKDRSFYLVPVEGSRPIQTIFLVVPVSKDPPQLIVKFGRCGAVCTPTLQPGSSSLELSYVRLTTFRPSRAG